MSNTLWFLPHSLEIDRDDDCDLELIESEGNNVDCYIGMLPS